ncbi:MAG TPA: RNA 3'-terminal phosphate cyclase [Nitrososphaerales archaeon]|nr:RNA 3'-terminal phosphate cyclase [Nitrososphaerales archaeon]
MEQVEVDGSQGEGGGQILRTAVAFSVIRRVPVRVVKIRAGRDVPGLKRQHVSALKVLASVFGGSLEGAEEGSAEVRFVPGKPRLQSYAVDMGTAASITLVLQAVIPAVALSGSRLSLSLTGGTDVPWSPTFDYFRSVVIGGYRAIGVEAEVKGLRRGYYPRGGGVVSAEILGCPSVRPLELTARPVVPGASLASRCGMLPKTVAERQAKAAAEWLGRSGIVPERTEVTEEQSSSPGTSVMVCAVGDGFFIGSDALGSRGKRAEEVGAEAADGFLSALGTGSCMDANLADMVMPLLSLAPAPSRVKVPAVTPHLESGLRLAEQFTSCTWSAAKDGNGVVVTVVPHQS